MGSVAGVELKYAIKKGVTWGTAVECGALDGLMMLPTSISRDAGVETDDSQGLFWTYDGTPGAVKVEGELPGYLRYDGLDLLLALFVGSTGGAPTQQGATAAYAYSMDFTDHIDGLFATFARHMKNYVAEVPSVKIAGITLKGDRGKALQLILHTIGDNFVEDGVNDATTFNNVTVAETGNRVQFSQGVFRMNDQSDIALAVGNVINPTSFELTAKRDLAGVYDGSNQTSAPNVQDLIDEPTNNGRPVVTLKMLFPRHTSKTSLDDLGADTRKKMDIVFTGGEIASPYNREFKLEFPHLQIASTDIVDESGIIKEPVEFICYGANTAPAGMTGITKPFRVSGINQRTTDPLA